MGQAAHSALASSSAMPADSSCAKAPVPYAMCPSGVVSRATTSTGVPAGKARASAMVTRGAGLGGGVSMIVAVGRGEPGGPLGGPLGSMVATGVGVGPGSGGVGASASACGTGEDWIHVSAALSSVSWPFPSAPPGSRSRLEAGGGAAPGRPSTRGPDASPQLSESTDAPPTHRRASVPPVEEMPPE